MEHATTSESCSQCQKIVRNRQEALLCDICNRWNHRTCDTGITRDKYRELKRKGEFDWHCKDCHVNPVEVDITNPEFESTRRSQDVGHFTLELSDFIHDSSEAPNNSQIQNPSISYQSPEVNQESLLEPVEEDSQMDVDIEEEINWEIIKGATERMGTHLVNSYGYKYVIHKNGKAEGVVYWRCSQRNSAKCKARVNQNGHVFTPGLIEHVCQPKFGANILARVRAECNVQARAQPFTSARRIVETAIRSVVPEGHPVDLPHPDNLARNANRQRQQGRPRHPNDLFFEIQEEVNPADFFLADVHVNGRRHILYATNHQLRLLKKAKNWFVDATFKVVRKPFCQLFTIHAFITSDGTNMKQVPLLFVIMSGKRTCDYRSVYQWLKESIADLAVKSITSDFECAMWLAATKVFGNDLQLHGCLFHWQQAVFRKIQEYGLVPAYMKKRKTYNFIKEIMALPYLPQEWISRVFIQIAEKELKPRLRQLVDYVGTQWIHNTVFIIKSWSVYRRPFRTNNDVEGWHNRLNLASNNAGLNFYKMIHLLHDEAIDVDHTCQFLTNGVLLRRQRILYRKLHELIYEAWNEFDNGDLTAKDLLKKCGKISAGRFPINK